MINIAHLRKTAIACMVALSMGSVIHQPSHAGAMAGGATEITQLLNNFQLAEMNLVELEQLMTQVNSYITQVQQYATMLAQLAKLDVSKMLGLNEVLGTLNKLKELKGSIERVYGSVTNLKGGIESQFRAMSLANMTPEQYFNAVVEREGSRKKATEVLLGNTAENIADLKNDVEQMKTLGDGIGAVQGVTGAVQVVAASVNKMIDMQIKSVADLRTHMMYTYEKDLAQGQKKAEEAEMAAKLIDGYAKERLRQLRMMDPERFGPAK